MSKLWLAAFLLVLGCGDRPFAERYQVVIDAAFTDEEAGRIVSALDAWTDAVGVRFDVVFDDSFVTGECSREKDDRICFTPSQLPVGLEGWTLRNGRQSSLVQVDPLASGPTGNEWWYDYTVRHEIGHALGLQHTQQGTLMYRYIGPDTIVTCADRQQYWDLRRFVVLGCAQPYVLSHQ